MQLRADGPFCVITDTSNTATIDKSDLFEVVTLDRVTKVPSPEPEPDQTKCTDIHDAPVSFRTRQRTQHKQTTLNTSDTRRYDSPDHVVDTVVDYDEKSRAFRVH